MAPVPEQDELVEEEEEVGGIRIAHGRVPTWLLLVIVGVVSWGLYYLITFTVNETGSFSTNPTEVVGLLGL